MTAAGMGRPESHALRIETAYFARFMEREQEVWTDDLKWVASSVVRILPK